MARSTGSGTASELTVSASLLAALVLLVVGPVHAASMDERMAACLACHGAQGQSRTPETPSLGGQPAFFVVAQLFLFREGRRPSGPMTVAKPFTDDDLRAFAARVEALPPPAPPEEPLDRSSFARGQALARTHHCVVCHRPDLSGQQQVPRLANQREDYLLKTMREFKRGTRIGYGGTMTQELVPLTDADLVDLAHFLAHAPRPR
jgi:cytochrome c553